MKQNHSGRVAGKPEVMGGIARHTASNGVGIRAAGIVLAYGAEGGHPDEGSSSQRSQIRPTRTPKETYSRLHAALLCNLGELWYLPILLRRMTCPNKPNSSLARSTC